MVAKNKTAKVAISRKLHNKVLSVCMQVYRHEQAKPIFLNKKGLKCMGSCKQFELQKKLVHPNMLMNEHTDILGSFPLTIHTQYNV